MQERVHDKFKLDLVPEWKTMGTFTDDQLSVWHKKTVVENKQ
jgi:hypothetical protein